MSAHKKKEFNEDECVGLIFPVLQISGKTMKKLAEASEVFSTQFEWIRNGNDDMNIEITDCSKEAFCTFIKIIEGEVEIEFVLARAGISVLMELLYLAEKYQINNKVLGPTKIRSRISEFVINESNLITCIKNFLKWKDVTIFEFLDYNYRKNECAKVFLKCVNKYNMMLEVAEIDDSELKLRCLDELAEFERHYKLCGNCRELERQCRNGDRLHSHYLGVRVRLFKNGRSGCGNYYSPDEDKEEKITGKIISEDFPLKLKHSDGTIHNYAVTNESEMYFLCK